MQGPNALLLLLIGLGGHNVLAAPTFDLFDDALGDYTNGQFDEALGDFTNGQFDDALGDFTNGQFGQQDVARAARLWQRDTQTVSTFLSTAETLSPAQLQNQGTIALAAAKDELVQKAALDRVLLRGTANGRDAGVFVADDTLARQGTFDFVVSGLALFAKRGAQLTPDEVTTLVRAVNQDRCPNVLPSVNAYLAAAEAYSGGVNGRLTAVRPSNC